MSPSAGRALPETLRRRLRLPLIAAPMLRVSGPDLVVAACRAGVIGAFPTANARSSEELDHWLRLIGDACADAGGPTAPFCPNLIIRQERFREDLGCLVRRGVEMVITSVGSPLPAIRPLHDVGCLVFADVASLSHAEKALDAGADGLVLLSAGAGGQTGWANGFAFVRAVRAFFAGPVVLAGGISDGQALWAAEALGCDLAYMGTRFIATDESLAAARYKQMAVESSLDDVMLTRAFTGLDANMLRPSIVAAGLDPDALPEDIAEERARDMYGSGGQSGPKRWRDVWSAGHAVSGVRRVSSVAGLIDETEQEYRAARAASFARWRICP